MILDFLSTYWREILLVVEILITIILFIVKKRNKYIYKFDYSEILKKVLEFLPMLISKVEIPGNGELKKKAVLDMALEYISKLLHRSLDTGEVEFFSQFIDESIESILETPSKKEVK